MVTGGGGALVKFDVPEIRYLFDWECPSNRFNIKRNDNHWSLSKGFPYFKRRVLE